MKRMILAKLRSGRSGADQRTSSRAPSKKAPSKKSASKKSASKRAASRWAPYVVLLACLPLLGNRSDCDFRPAELTCTTESVVVQPGQCVPISNPCDSQWQAQDGFKLCNDPPVGLSVQTTRSRGVVTRLLCADPATKLLSNVRVDFLYTQVAEFGEGSLDVTVGIPLAVAATANPGAINPGESSQLTATASGGAGGYSYSWTPSGTLTDPTIADPVASPMVTTTYTATVTDLDGSTASTSVTVNVGAFGPLSVTATPPSIAPGFLSQLSAQLNQPPVGVPTYSWTPVSSLSNPNIANPLAAPTTTTTYHVTATDAFGTFEGSVEVDVQLLVNASATPSSILVGDSSQLGVSVFGGVPPYAYSWQPAASLDDPTLAAPVATPATATTYQVTVTDTRGASSTGSVTVDVQDPGAVLAACFTVTPDPPPAVGQATFDFSCSTGVITLYELWLAWSGDPAQLPVYSSSVRSYSTFNEVAGCNDVRLRVTDSSGGTAAVVRQVCYQ